MKKNLLVSLTICISVCARSQINLVPNWSFEDYSSCPSFTGDLDKAVGWTCYNESPDYFNECANLTPELELGVPVNARGHQMPIHGNSYIGIGTYFKTSSDTREHGGVMLQTPLDIGTTYYVSYHISLADTVSLDCPTNKIGVRFTMTEFDYLSSPSPIDNFAHIYSNAIVTDQVNWTKVFGSFVADAAYPYLMLGNFFDDANTDTVNCWGPSSSVSYYYVDAVCVSTDSSFTQNYLGLSNSDLQNRVQIFPSPTSDFLNIYCSECASDIHYSMTDLSGKSVLAGIIESSVAIDMRSLANGLYIINLRSGDDSIEKKIIKN